MGRAIGAQRQTRGASTRPAVRDGCAQDDRVVGSGFDVQAEARTHLRGKGKYGDSGLQRAQSRMTCRCKVDRSGLQPSDVVCLPTWGFAPGWYRSRRWRAETNAGILRPAGRGSE